MCGVSLNDRKRSVDLYSLLGVADVVRRGRFRWFGHLERIGVWMIGYWPVERWRWQLVLQHHLMDSMMACGARRTVVVTGSI